MPTDNTAHDAVNWTTALVAGVGAGLGRFLSGIPTVLGGLLILLIGWMIAKAVGALCAKGFRAAHVDTLAERIKVNDFLQRAGTKHKASDILGMVLKWVVFLIFVDMAADQMGLGQVSTIINRMIAYIPNILVAMLILGLGAFLGQLVSGIVRGAASEAGLSNSELLAKVASGAVMTFAIIAAINQLGIAPVVVNTLYIGLVAAISLALGLAFGLGGRDTAARLTEQWVGSAQQTAAKAAQTVAQAPQTAAQAPPLPAGDYARRTV